MKILLILLAVLATPLLTAQEKELFQVSKVGGDKSKLIEIFQRVQLLEAGNGADIAAYHVIKRIDARRFLVHSIKKEQDPFSAKSKPDLTQAQFIKALKSGERWTLENYARKKCFECFGKGNSGPLQGNVKCGACNGEGMVFADCVVEW